jgi:hypothetical protein
MPSYREPTMKGAPATKPRSFGRRLLRAQLIFTVCPAVLLPASALVLGAIFPGGALTLLYLFFFYFLPASLIANSLGYKTVEGAPPLPVPASSLTALMVLLAVHATLVALVFLVWQAMAVSLRRARRWPQGRIAP